jgi:hypothetical protein
MKEILIFEIRVHIFVSVAQQAIVGQGPLPDNKQYSQETSVYVPAGFEFAIAENERLHTHDLDPAGTGVGKCVFVV